MSSTEQSDNKIRCEWVGSNEMMIAYHDREWGVPEHNDKNLFEKLCLDGAQAGLSWLTVLQKREAYRELFYNFDAEKIASMDDTSLEALLLDARIIRNRLKVFAFRKNAIAYLQVKEEFASFDEYIWQFVNHSVIKNTPCSISDYKTTSEESNAMSKALKKRGFSFVGSTICYAFMQAVGMVNDHGRDCWRVDICE